MTTVVQRVPGNKKRESNASGETEETKIHAYDFGGPPGAAVSLLIQGGLLKKQLINILQAKKFHIVIKRNNNIRS